MAGNELAYRESIIATLQRAAGNVHDDCPDAKNNPQLPPRLRRTSSTELAWSFLIINY
jgi:hypothetical protein